MSSRTHSSTRSDTSSLMDLNASAEVAHLYKIIQEAYESRLSGIEKNLSLSESQKLKQKVAALESYVKSLNHQANDFSSAISNLEVECMQRVAEVEKKLKKSAKATREAAINMYEYEKETKRLVEERLYIEALYKQTRLKQASLMVDNQFLKDSNGSLSHDIQSLLRVIQHARSTGNWEMECISFCEVSPEQVFGPIQSLSNHYAPDIPSNIDRKLFLEKVGQDSKKRVNLSSSFSSDIVGLPFSSPERVNANFSLVHHDSSYLPRCASLPEIGNIYISQAVYKSISCDTNEIKRLLGEKVFKHKRTVVENTVQTPELLKDLPFVKNLEERICNNKSQSEPHLFMFDGQIYKYTPGEPKKKPSGIALNENSCLLAHQSIDLKFPTEGSTLKMSAWNKLKSGSCLDDQEYSYLKGSIYATASDTELSEVNMNGLFRPHLSKRKTIAEQGETELKDKLIQRLEKALKSSQKEALLYKQQSENLQRQLDRLRSKYNEVASKISCFQFELGEQVSIYEGIHENIERMANRHEMEELYYELLNE